MPSPTTEFDGFETPVPVREAVPAWGFVLGSGIVPHLSGIETIAECSYGEIEGIPAPTVPGHDGRLAWLRLGGSVLLMACGRVHLYENRSAQDVAAMVRLMAKLGVRRLLLTNAAGSLDSAMSPGSLMLIRDQINLTGASPLCGGPHFIDLTDLYSAALRRRIGEAAASIGMALPEGVYAGVRGPQYETPAEVRMLRALGADAVGMSTVLEAIQARALGMEVAGLSLLTNWAAGIQHDHLSHDEVLRRGHGMADQLGALLRAVV
jgi:purine-nucleoside phosphorylase